MQPMSHDGYKREMTPEQWVEAAKSRPQAYEEQEDQWAVLRHEVEGERMQGHEERMRPAWDQRNTDADAVNTVTPGASFDDLTRAQPHVDIVVVGVGGGGMNAVNRMIHTRVRGVRFIAMNTDAQVLGLSQASDRICLGQHYTKGLGAGGNAAAGMRAATESAAEIRAALADADLVFIAAGMGGGTGTGAAPVVASIARKLGALTIGIVTLPFSFEGSRRRRVAQEGLNELSAEVDALITIPNDRLLATTARDQNLAAAFKVADDVLRQGVQGIAEVINVPGMVNVDFADVRNVLHNAGTALMSIGEGRGRARAQQAAETAVAGGFLNVTIRGAKRVLFNISGGEDMTLFEINEVAERIGQAIDHAADITFGAVIDPMLVDTIHVTLIAAGMEEVHTSRLQAVRLDRMEQQQQPAPTPTPFPTQPAPTYNRPAPTRPPTQEPVAPPPSQAPSRLAPPQRQQRSLSDLRGIRSLGRRHEELREQREQEDDPNVPPFLRRRNQP